MLGTLRGLAAKVGQMASYVDGIVPGGTARRLRGVDEGAASGRAQVVARGDPRVRRGGARRAHRQALRAAGATSRSRARRSARCTSPTLPDGREVAVKVQHPGDRRRRSRATSRTRASSRGSWACSAASASRPKKMFAVIRARFREELDYGLEAERLHALRAPARGRSDRARPGARPLAQREARPHDRARARSHLRRGLRGAGGRSDARGRETMWRFVFKGTLRGGDAQRRSRTPATTSSTTTAWSRSSTTAASRRSTSAHRARGRSGPSGGARARRGCVRTGRRRRS